MCVLIYVDDIILTGNSAEAISSLVRDLNCEFSVKNLGSLTYFLGIEVIHSSNGLLLLQRKYITDLLMKTHLSDAKPVHTPMSSSIQLSRHLGDPHPSPTIYRSIVGALQYLSFTRPDISFSIGRGALMIAAPLVATASFLAPISYPRARENNPLWLVPALKLSTKL
ncbi:hypothetical protein RJ640_026825 [Escallonia rubra]|uniref:Reverse transcriptase Ty1/copia-type domain-containing protein n=1 Tax=Escallonia rubra TaxID=112253 RepID=A0AA88SG14_9ASTE|nr:hypothetical protein RJ640_026825 [Escallonia rubra]